MTDVCKTCKNKVNARGYQSDRCPTCNHCCGCMLYPGGDRGQCGGYSSYHMVYDGKYQCCFGCNKALNYKAYFHPTDGRKHYIEGCKSYTPPLADPKYNNGISTPIAICDDCYKKFEVSDIRTNVLKELVRLDSRIQELEKELVSQKETAFKQQKEYENAVKIIESINRLCLSEDVVIHEIKTNFQK